MGVSSAGVLFVKDFHESNRIEEDRCWEEMGRSLWWVNANWDFGKKLSIR